MVVGRRMWALMGLASVSVIGSRATAQTQGDFTVGLSTTTAGQNDQFGYADPGVTITHEGSPGAQCAQSTNQAGTLTLLRFNMYTQNDGYQDITLDFGERGFVPNTTLLQDFATFTLVSATSNANVIGSLNGTQFPATGIKEDFGWSDDDSLPYRPTSSLSPNNTTCTSLPGPHPEVTEPNCPYSPAPIDFLGYGYVDRYAIDDDIPCQFVQIDGVGTGDHDLVVEENTDRLFVCNASNDSNCTHDGRVYDNVNAMRIHIVIDPVNGDTVTPLPPQWNTATEMIGPTQNPLAAGPPAVVSHGVNTYNLFFVGGGALFECTQDTTGAWLSQQGLASGASCDAQTSAMVSVPGYSLAGTLTAVAIDKSRTDVFGTATSGDVFEFSNNPPTDGTAYRVSLYGAASGNPSLGASSTPIAVASGPQSAMVAWVTPQGALAYGLYDGTGWLAPQILPGVTCATGQTPALTSSGDGMFHLFVQDASGLVWYAQYFSGMWTSWQPLPGPAITGNLVAASPSLNSVFVFGRTSDNRLVSQTWYGAANSFAAANTFANQWADFLVLDPDFTIPGSGMSTCNVSPTTQCSTFDTRVGSTPTAISTGAQKMDLLFYDTVRPQLLWQLHYDGTTVLDPGGQAPGSWSLQAVGRQSLGSLPMWPPVVSSWSDNTLDVYQKVGGGTIGIWSMR